MKRQEFWYYLNRAMRQARVASGIARECFKLSVEGDMATVSQFTVSVGDVQRCYRVDSPTWAQDLIADASEGTFGPPRLPADVRAALTPQALRPHS